VLIKNAIKDSIEVVDGIFRSGARVPNIIGAHGGAELLRPAPLIQQKVLWVGKHHFADDSDLMEAPSNSGRSTPITAAELGIVRFISGNFNRLKN